MAKPRPPVEVKPGKLMSGLSAESAGVANYTVKQEFRRVLERDVRAEGYEWYRPNPIYDKLIQSIPTGSASPVTIISECGLANGRIALVAGNQTTLWRYVGLEQPAYFNSDYFDAEGGLNYFHEGMAGWQVIGSGFSVAGRRWEAVQVGELLVLNNGVDLPVTYNLQESCVKPIYELREKQVACVGTIAAQNGILCCMDITQINDEAFLAIMAPVPAAANASQDATGKIAPAAATLFPDIAPANLVGLTLFWAGGQTTHIDSIDGDGFIHTNSSGPVNDSFGMLPFTANQSSADAATVSGAVLSGTQAIYTIAVTKGGTYVITPGANEDGAAFANGSQGAALASGTKFIFTAQGSSVTITIAKGLAGINAICPTLGGAKDGFYAIAPLIPYLVGYFTNATLGSFTENQYAQWSDPVGDSTPFHPSFSTLIPPSGTGGYNWITNNWTITPVLTSLTAVFDVFVQSWIPTYSAVVIGDSSVAVENVAAYALFNDPNSTQRRGARFFPSMPSQPRRFGAAIPLSISAGSRIGTLLFPVRSIPELLDFNYTGGAETDFIITNVGIGSTNLNANVIACTPGITASVLLDQTAMTEQPFGSGTLQDKLQSSLALIEAGDAAAGFAGIFEDLDDDEGVIIKALTLQGQLVIYKETPFIFLASYTGDLTTPFQFQKIPIQSEAAALHHRNTLIAGGGGYFGSYHLYAGKNAFYKFTLFTGTPVEEPTLQQCQNIFFENASDNENTFAVENPLTREIYFVFPNSGSIDTDDRAICLDYAYNTARTTTVPISAAAKARHPVTRDYWFVMGLADGSIKRYGLFSSPRQSSGNTTARLAAGLVTSSGGFFTPAHVGMGIIFADGTMAAIAEYLSPTSVTAYSTGSVSGQTFIVVPAIWHRDGQPYQSYIESGMDSFGLSHGEKQLNEYVLSLSSKSYDTPLTDAPVTVGFLGGVNANGTVMQSGVIKKPNFQNLLKPTLMHYYIGINVTINGLNNPLEITGHLLNVIPVTSHSFGRRPTR